MKRTALSLAGLFTGMLVVAMVGCDGGGGDKALPTVGSEAKPTPPPPAN